MYMCRYLKGNMLTVCESKSVEMVLVSPAHPVFFQAHLRMFSQVQVLVYMYNTCTCTYTFYNTLIGNHTFAAIRGCESYHLLQSLSDVIGEINTLATSESPTVDGLKIDVVFGGDYKVRLSASMYNHTSTCTGIFIDKYDLILVNGFYFLLWE